MKKPNFFIIGAPKCGTTSLAAWLTEHPQVFFSPHKEPHHFNKDHNHRMCLDLDEYENLFRKADNRHLAVGEASVWYLYSEVAVSNIEQYSSNSKYIVCLRNPAEMAYSLHEQLVVAGYESETDFEMAWNLQKAREQGIKIPALCREPRFLAYGAACSIGAQLQRLYMEVPRERIHIILLDDVKDDPRGEYLKVLSFIGCDDDGRMGFSIKNPAKELRAPILLKLVRALGNGKRFFRIRKSLGVLNLINRLNIKHRARVPLTEEMKQMLKEYFKQDIKLLSTLIGRNLSHWTTD